MGRKITTVLFSMFAAAAIAQDANIDNRLANIDWKEDTVEITTINNIIETQQELTTRAARENHYKKVWKNHGFFNIAYNTKATLTPKGTDAPGAFLIAMPQSKDNIETGLGAAGYNGGIVPTFTADWGVTIMAGKNIKLHKPIAQSIQFNIDFTGIDLTMNHFSAEPGSLNTTADERDIYDSQATFNYYDKEGLPDGTRRYSHWNLNKIDISYGMSVGPSLTIAPFAMIHGAEGLHFLKFNIYYHVGYNAALLLMLDKTEYDLQYQSIKTGSNPTAAQIDKFKTDKKALDDLNENQLLLGHNIYQTFGFNMTWKRIGIGYEHRWGSLKYKNLMGKSEYGDYSYKFDNSTNRFYITYRFGR